MKKKVIILIGMLTTMLFAAGAFAFDPSLQTRTGLAAKAEIELNKYKMNDGVPDATIQLYGAGATYQMNTGTKVGFSVGGAFANIDNAFGTKDYTASAPYIALGVSQKVYKMFGVDLGLFADGTYMFEMKDKFLGVDVTVSGLNAVQAGAVAQYEVMKNLNLYGGANGQWINGTVSAGGAKDSLTNANKLSGFAGIKYDMGSYTFDLNASGGSKFRAGANLSYNF